MQFSLFSSPGITNKRLARSEKFCLAAMIVSFPIATPISSIKLPEIVVKV